MTRKANREARLATPVHAIILAFPVALFPSALIADIAYLNTAVIQWTNFSSWLIAGAVFFSGILLAWALISLFAGRKRREKGRETLYLAVVAAMFILGMINALHHARDGWHSVGMTGLILSVLCALLALASAFIANPRTSIEEPIR